MNGIFIQEHAKAVSLHDEVVVLYSNPSKKCTVGYQISDKVENNIRTIRVSIKMPSVNDSILYFAGVFVGYKYLTSRGYKPQVIHAHLFAAGLPAIFLGKIYGIPVILSEHWSGFSLRSLKWHGILIAKLVMSKARFVCIISKDLKQHIENYGIEASFQIIPNTVDINLFQPRTKNLRKDEKQTKRILFVGSLLPVKGIPYLLKAAKIVKEKRDDFRLDIVGNGSNRNQYEALSRKLGLEDVVHFHGKRSKSEVAEFMRGCDFFILPSVWENQPCVLIEAMASGKPIVATKVGGISEIISDRIGILVPPRDVNTLVESVNFMLENYENYNPEEIRSIAVRRFSLEAVGKMLDQVYWETLSQER